MKAKAKARDAAGNSPAEKAWSDWLVELQWCLTPYSPQAVDVAAPLPLLNFTAQEPHKLLSVRLIQKEGVLRIAARREVGEGPGKLQTKWTSHAAGLEAGPGVK